MLATIERLGNRLPDPAILFVWLLLIVWVASWALAGIDWNLIDPRDGAPLVVRNQLTGEALTTFLSSGLHGASLWWSIESPLSR